MPGGGRNIQKKKQLGRSSGKYEISTEMELKKCDVRVWGGINILFSLYVAHFLNR
jgi:hypothetical protein